MARMNFSAINGLAVVDVSTGVRAGEARTFSVTFKCGSKGLLVERGPDHIVLVEPSRILGMGTAAAVIDLARKKHIEMPIAEAVHAIIEGRISVDDAITALMLRPLKAED